MNLQSMSPDQRVMVLQDSADKVEQTTYLKKLSPEEMDRRREEFTDESMRIEGLEDELKATSKEYRDSIKEGKKMNRVRMQALRTGHDNITGTLFHCANHDEGYMYTYDQDGEEISRRRLRPDEKQTTIFNLPKASNQ